MKKYRLLKILIIVFLLFVVLQLPISVIIYESIFSRYETSEKYMKYPKDYNGLQVEDVSFTSAQGNKLAGYVYTNENITDYDGVIIISHGLFGGGQNSYMDVADYFASDGFIVFAYDATGNDKSEGKSVRGVPQGVCDLDYAIDYVEADDLMGDYPICLWGHSWGAYSADAVLNFHPEVKAVVSCSGFNRSSDMLEAKGVQYVGNIARAGLFYVNLYERLKFGKYAAAGALGGFENSDANIMVIHSADDHSVQMEYGYDKYYEQYGNDPRFTFRLFEDRGHSAFYSDAENTVPDEALFEEMSKLYHHSVKSGVE